MDRPALVLRGIRGEQGNGVEVINANAHSTAVNGLLAG